jgi:hypothetical protein
MEGECVFYMHGAPLLWAIPLLHKQGPFSCTACGIPCGHLSMIDSEDRFRAKATAWANQFVERPAAIGAFLERRVEFVLGCLPAFTCRAMRLCSVSCLIFFQSSILFSAPFPGLSREFAPVCVGHDTPDYKHRLAVGWALAY